MGHCVYNSIKVKYGRRRLLAYAYSEKKYKNVTVVQSETNRQTCRWR